MSKYLHTLGMLALFGAFAAWQLILAPFDGRGPGAVAPAGIRENPASWRAVYVPYVSNHGSGGGGGYSLGK